MSSAKLIFFCGKMAAGKSTLARKLAQREHAVLLVQDELLESLYPGEITDMARSQLKNRSKDLPPGTPWTTEAEFEAITLYFQPPSEDEGFNVVRHDKLKDE